MQVSVSSHIKGHAHQHMKIHPHATVGTSLLHAPGTLPLTVARTFKLFHQEQLHCYNRDLSISQHQELLHPLHNKETLLYIAKNLSTHYTWNLSAPQHQEPL